MRIVIGWNGTSEARDALHLGGELARVFGASVVVACVIDTGVVPPALAGHRDEWVSRLEGLLADARIELGEQDFALREAIDDPISGLTEIALEEDADLLVVGHTHRGLFGRLLPGSTAERLLAHAPCPVAVAPENYAHRPLLGLGLVGVAYDGSRSSRAAVEFAAELAALTDGEVEIFSAAPEYTAGEFPLGPLHALREEPRLRVERALARVPRGVSKSGEVLSGNVAAALEERGIELDFLVMGTHGRGPLRGRLLGSVSADVMRIAPCPVVVIPEGTRVKHYDRAATSAEEPEGADDPAATDEVEA